MESKFVHLHLHTEYSLLDGAVRLDRITGKKPDGGTIHSYPLKEALIKDGQQAVAITDHGNMYGVYAFVSTLKGSGIKPIIGEEFYVAPDMYDKRAEVMRARDHLIILAKNEQGYKNLMVLSSKAFVDGFYQKPRIDLKLLEQHSEGLICLSACLAGRIPRYLLANEYDKAKDYALKLKSMFAEGDFYIELQDHGLQEDKFVLPQLVKLAKEIGVKVVATNDVHYISREDADIQDTMMCIQMGIKKTDVSAVRFDNDNFYLKSQQEMIDLFDWCPEAIESTVEIADKCNFEFTLKRNSIIPRYTNDEMNGRDEAQYLHDLAYERILTRYPEITPEIKDRLDYELSVIIECGYAGYFLIVWDFVNAARLRGIPVGPGRGSGVGSLVAYSIGITDVDPLRYNLIFERFLSKERVSMPDFDIDFCYNRRGEIIDYVTEKYGKDNVSQIIAYSTMSAKAAIKDVARVYDVSFQDANNWVKDLPKMGKPFIGESLGEWGKEIVPAFKELYDSNPEAKRIIDIAKGLEGMPRQVSMHAAGVVICPDPIVEHVPLQRNGDDITTQFDKGQIESVGLLKMDFLALKTLTDINEAEKYIFEDKGVKIDFNKLGYDDPEVYKLIASGDCEGVFQLESNGMKQFMAKLKPDKLEEVIAGISIFRPGPIQFMDDYINGKKEPEKVKYAHPVLKDILGVTYGCIVYQEQVMQIAKDLAGFSFGGADIMRRAIAKKKLDILNENKAMFIHGGDMTVAGGVVNHVKGCVANGVPEEVAEKLWNQILDFASYAFNKSHAAAYAVVSYQTAYLKRYYPLHYIMAVANNRISSSEEVKHYVNYIKESGYKIYPPDINKSSKLFTIEGEGMRYGLNGIKNMGDAAMETILTERKQNGDYKDIRDLVSRNPEINKRMLESLIKGGALDCFGKTRATLIASYEQIVDSENALRKNTSSNQISLFDDLIEDVPVKYIELPEYDKTQKLNFEKDVLGMYVSGHPLDDFRGNTQGFNFSTEDLFVESVDEDGNAVLVGNSDLDGKNVCFGGIIGSFEKRLSKNNTRFATGKVEDFYGVVTFAMFGRAFERNQALLQTETPVIINGKLDMKVESEPKVVIDTISIWHKKEEKTDSVTTAKKQAANAAPIKNESKTKLYVRVCDRGLLDVVINFLKRFEGETPVVIKAEMGAAPQVFEFNGGVELSDEFVLKLKNIVGNDNAKVVTKTKQQKN